MTKNTFRVLACIVIVFVFILALASCEQVGKIFDKHEHSYTHTVTPPSCEGKGYTTHTCECGDSYVDGYIDETHVLVIHDAKEPTCTEVGYDEYFTCRKCDYTTYVEKAALGHAYVEKITRIPTTVNPGIRSRICSECGETHDEEIEAVAVTLPHVAEFIKTFVGMNEISINADNTEIVFIDEIDSEDGTTKRYIAIDLTCFEVSGKGEELYAHITFDLGIATLDPSAEESEPELSTQMQVEIFATGDDVSVSVTEGDKLENSDIDLTEEFYGYIAEYFGMTYEELAETYYLVSKVAEYLPMLEDVLEWFSSVELPDGSVGFEAFVALIRDEIVSVDEEGYHYIDIAGLVDLVKSNQNKTVAEIVDAYFGTGTMASVETFLIALPQTKVKTLAKGAEALAEEYGISVDDVYAFVNYLVYTVSGKDFNIEHELKIRYNKTVAEVIAELSSQGEDVTEADINMMALAMVNEMKNIINLVKSNSIDQLYNIYTYDDADFDYSFTDEIISKLEAIDSDFDAKWHLCEDGQIDAIDIVITGMFGFSYDVTGEGVLSSVEIYSDEGRTLGFTSSITDLEASFVILSDSHEILVFSSTYDAEALLSAEFKLNTLYVGAVDGYTEKENLLNVLTATYLKGEGSDFAVTIVLNMITEKAGETPDETVAVYEKAIDIKAEYDGENTLVITSGTKVVTSVASENENGVSVQITAKDGDTVISDITASVTGVLDENGLVSEADIAVNGQIEGSSISITLDYADNRLSSVCKIDDKEIANVLLGIGEDGSIDADLVFDGVNITTEILSYIREIVDAIESSGALEELPEVNADMAA